MLERGGEGVRVYVYTKRMYGRSLTQTQHVHAYTLGRVCCVLCVCIGGVG